MLDKPGHLPGTVNGFSNTRVAVPESAAPSPDHAAEHRAHPVGAEVVATVLAIDGDGGRAEAAQAWPLRSQPIDGLEKGLSPARMTPSNVNAPPGVRLDFCARSE